MSNIVAMALCRIKDSSNLEYNQDKGADKTYTLYSSMCEILCESADRHIAGDWDFEIIENEVENYQEIFDTNFGEVYDMWDGGKNNILFLDLDTFVIGDVDVFDKLVWDLGWKYAKDWDYNIWGTEQIIFNEMMYSQNRDHTKWLTPEMNYQMMNAVPELLDNPNYITQLNMWNNTQLNKSKIVHLHGTRGAEQTLLTQWTLWKKLTSEEFEFENVKVVDGRIEYK